ncbi:MAG: PH domain-containing protein [Actinomycetota bacterium]|nr:PH domain-containing protein [Actinomycetota bacterium]
MSTALSTPAALTGAQWQRLSRRMLLVNPVMELGRAVPALIGLFFAGSTNGGGSGGSVWSVIGGAAVIALGVLHWFTTRYRITPDQIQLRRGLLRRVTIAAPLDRVRTVDVTAHLLHRALGLSKVAIGTGISDRKGHSRLVLDGLPAPAAARLRAELLHRDGAAQEPSAVPTGDEQIAHLELAWIRYAPFTLSGAITSVAVFGFGWRLVNEAHVRLSHLGPLRVIGNDLQRTSVAIDVAAIVVLVITVLTLASTIGYVLAFWGFQLSRHDGGSLHVARGLITSRATSIERRRLVGAELSEPLLLRAVGGARCMAIATGLRAGRGAERGGEILLPPAPEAQAVRVTAIVLGSSGPATQRLRQHPPAALRRRLVRACAGAVLVVLIVGLLVVLTPLSQFWWFACLALLGLAPPLAFDRYRSLGHAFIDGYVVTRVGSIVRRRSAIASDAVIGWNLTSSLLQRHAGLTTLTATTAAGKQGYEIVDAAEDEALRFAEAASPGLLTQFLQTRSVHTQSRPDAVRPDAVRPDAVRPTAP